MSQKKLALVLAWAKASAELKAAKAAEAEAKAAAVAACFSELDDGVNTVNLPGGYVFKATHYPTYKLDAGKTPAVISSFVALGALGADLARRLFREKFELSISEYKRLSPDGQALLKDALTVSPATPKLELVEPA